METPALFTVGTVVEPICKDEGCDVKENPDHFTTIQLSDTVRDAIKDAVDYIKPDCKASPSARNLFDRLTLILAADKKA